MRNGVIASLLAVLILISLGAGYFFGTSSQRAQTSTAAESTQTITIYTRGNSPATANLISITSVRDETFVTWSTTLNTCASCTTHGGGSTFTYPLAVNYSGGQWDLHYWVQNFSGTQNSISGNLNGSGNSQIWITFYVAGYAQYTLCASATKLPNDSQQNGLPLTLSGLGPSESTTNSTSAVEVCGTMAV